MNTFIKSHTCCGCGMTHKTYECKRCGCMSHRLNLITERSHDEVIAPPEFECKKPQMEFVF